MLPTVEDIPGAVFLPKYSGDDELWGVVDHGEMEEC